jgi:hypothetical protein
MNLLSRRLLKLEKCFPQIVPRDVVSQAQVLALVRLSMTDLEILRAMVLRGDSENSLSEAEESARNHYKEALIAVAKELQLPLGAPVVNAA